MRIAFVGNVNNAPHLLALGFAESGHECRLVPTRPEALHQPSSLRALVDTHTAEVTWPPDASLADSDFVDRSPRLRDLVADINEWADLVFLNDQGPSIADLLSVPHVAHLTGSDLTYYANYDSIHLREAGWSGDFRRSREALDHRLAWSHLVARQRHGIASAELIIHDPPGLRPDAEILFQGLGVMPSQRLALRLGNTFCSRASRPMPTDAPLRIACLARIGVRDADSAQSFTDRKGTDILLEGFRRFVLSGGDARLTVTTKGLDPARVQQYVTSQGIGRWVEWVPELSYEHYVSVIEDQHIVCDALSPIGPAGIAMDSMLRRRVVLGNLRPDVYSAWYGTALPGLHCETAADVAQALSWASAHPHLLPALAEEGNRAALRNFDPRVAARVVLERVPVRTRDTS